MQSCTNHSHRPAAWQCGRCGKSLCEQCAQGEQKAGLPTVVCVHCGGIAKVIRKPKDVRKYWQMFPDLIGALFHWQGLLQLFAVAVIVQFVGFFGCFGAIFGGGIYAGYYFFVLRNAANGSLELPKPGAFSNIVDDVLWPFVRMTVAMMLPVIPPVAYLLFRYQNGGLPEEPLGIVADPILWVIGIVCLLWIPGALIVAAVNDSVGAQLNPLNVLAIATRVPGEYLLTVVVWLALQGANLALLFGANTVAEILPIPIVMPILVRFVGLFVPMLTAMILGRLIYQNAETFGLMLAHEEMEPAQPDAIPRGKLMRDAAESSYVPGGPAIPPPVAERSVAPWDNSPRPGGKPKTLSAAAEASVAPWEKPAKASMPSIAEDSIPLHGDTGPRGTPPGFDGPPAPSQAPAGPSQAFAAAEESIPLDDAEEGPRGIRPGMGPATPEEDPFAPSSNLIAGLDPSANRPSLDDHMDLGGRFDDTPEPIPILDMPQPNDEEIAGSLHVGPGATFNQQPAPDQPSHDPEGTPVDHQPPAEDFAPQTLGGGLPPAAETSSGDAAGISMNLDAGALDNPLRMALESNDAHSVLMNFREQAAMGQTPDLSPELEVRLADMLEKAGQFGDAVMACKRASEKEPDGPLAAGATFQGARLLVERLGNQAQGMALLQYLLRHYGDDPAAEKARELLAQLQDQQE